MSDSQNEHFGANQRVTEHEETIKKIATKSDQA